MSEQAAAASRPYHGLVLDTHTLLRHAPDAIATIDLFSLRKVEN